METYSPVLVHAREVGPVVVGLDSPLEPVLEVEVDGVDVRVAGERVPDEEDAPVAEVVGEAEADRGEERPVGVDADVAADVVHEQLEPARLDLLGVDRDLDGRDEVRHRAPHDRGGRQGLLLEPPERLLRVGDVELEAALLVAGEDDLLLAVGADVGGRPEGGADDVGVLDELARREVLPVDVEDAAPGRGEVEARAVGREGRVVVVPLAPGDLLDLRRVVQGEADDLLEARPTTFVW